MERVPGLIERIEFSYHQLPLDPPFLAAWDHQPRTKFPVAIVKVHDGSGAVGIGAGDPMRGLEDHVNLFVGTDPLDLDRHGAVLTNIAFHDGRPWPLDTALWDLAGKLRGEPIWQMVGGRSSRVSTYASSGVHHDAADAAQYATSAATAGFGAMKLRFGRPTLDQDLAVLAAVRDVVPTDFKLMVDCNQGWRMPWDTDPPWALDHAELVARELSELGVFWMEEPLHRGDHSGMAELRKRTDIKIAGGEMTRELHEFDLMLDAGCLDVFQPDVVTTGGISALAGLARRVTKSGHIFSPHTWGSGVALLVNAHLTAGTVGTPFLEYPHDPPAWHAPQRDFILSEQIRIDDDGMITLSDRPGLGAEFDEEALAATATTSVTYS